MADRDRGRGGANWLLWLVIAIVVVVVLILLVPLLFTEDEGVDADDEIVEDEEEGRIRSYVIADTAHAAPLFQFADGQYVVVTL